MEFSFTRTVMSRSASAPELYGRSVETQTYKYTDWKIPSSELTVNGFQEASQLSYDSSYSQHESVPEGPNPFILPRTTFLSYAYLILIVQICISILQWLEATYNIKLSLNEAERSFYILMLLLAWLNLTLAFFGFRRLQMSFPINWIIFVCMFQSLTLLVLCMSMNDLTWRPVLISLLVLFIYMPLGLWKPSNLTVNLWILVLLSISVLVSSIFALLTGLSIHIYVSLIICLTVFGPWAMYNVYKLHQLPWESYTRFGYLENAAKMYITYGCTVAGLVVISRLITNAIETDKCKGAVFCTK